MSGGPTARDSADHAVAPLGVDQHHTDPAEGDEACKDSVFRGWPLADEEPGQRRGHETVWWRR